MQSHRVRHPRGGACGPAACSAAKGPGLLERTPCEHEWRGLRQAPSWQHWVTVQDGVASTVTWEAGACGFSGWYGHSQSGIHTRDAVAGLARAECSQGCLRLGGHLTQGRVGHPQCGEHIRLSPGLGAGASCQHWPFPVYPGGSQVTRWLPQPSLLWALWRTVG